MDWSDLQLAKLSFLSETSPFRLASIANPSRCVFVRGIIVMSRDLVENETFT